MCENSRNTIEDEIRTQRLATILRDSYDAITVQDLQGRVLDWNRGAVSMYGYSQEEALEMNINTIIPDEKSDELVNFTSELAEGKLIPSFETQRRTKDGRIIDVWLTVTTIMDSAGQPYAIATIERDITERKKNEVKSKLLATVLRESHDGITVQDRQGRVLAWNHGAELMYGYSEEEALEMNIKTIIPDDKGEELDDFTNTLLEGNIVPTFETKRITKDGRLIDVWLTVTNIMDSTGQPYAIATIERDITERNKNEESLKVANRELDAFVYTVSHDLRSPLTAIIGYADVLQETLRDILNKEDLECLEEISLSGHRMSELMENLLTLAKVGWIEKPKEAINTVEVVNNVVIGLSVTMSQARASVIVGDLPKVWIPRTFLSQVFDNLIGNAVLYAGMEGGSIEVGGEQNGNLVRFHVRDHGTGIPEEERSRIFDVFYRGTTGKKFRGTGVGLATVKKIARLYEGRSWAEETKGGGSTFWVEMRNDPK